MVFLVLCMRAGMQYRVLLFIEYLMGSVWNAEYKVVFAAVFVYFITLKASVKNVNTFH